jgi:INO80 complex subunit B
MQQQQQEQRQEQQRQKELLLAEEEEEDEGRDPAEHRHREQPRQQRQSLPNSEIEDYIKYTPSGIYIYVKEAHNIPTIMKEQKLTNYPPPRAKCAVSGCDKFKQYVHSKSGTPVCSLACYKIIDTK